MNKNNRSGKTYLLRFISLVIVAIGVNIALGYLVGDVLQWPLYLDSIGTILVGALLGPLAGAATGAFSDIIWSLMLGDQAILPFSITAAFIGWAAGFAVSHGAFSGERRLGKVIGSGLLVGAGAAGISAPIAAYVLGGVTGSGMDYLTDYLTTTGANILQAMTIEGFISQTLTPGAFSLITSDGNAQQTFTGITSGVFYLTDSASPFWQLTSATCDNGDSPTASPWELAKWSPVPLPI